MPAALATGAFGLTLVGIAGPSFWTDEGYSARLASLGPSVFVHFVTRTESNGVLYHLVLFPWVRVDTSEWFVRLPSVVFGAATVPVVYWIGRRCWSTGVGVVAAVLLPIHVYFLEFAQDARFYALFMLLATTSTAVLLRAVLDDDRRAWMAYPVVAALAVYAQYFAALTLLAHAVSLPLLGDRLPRRRAVRTAVVVGILVSPLALVALGPQSASLDSIPPTSFGAVKDLAIRLGNGKVATVLAGALILVAVVGWVRRTGRTGLGHGTWTVGLVLSTLVVPIVVAFLVSLVKPILLHRYFVATVPPACLLVAAGLLALRRAVLVGTVGLALLVAMVPTTADYFRDADDVRDRDAVRFLVANAGPDDAVAMGDFARVPVVQWYWERLAGGDPGPALVFPAVADHPLVTAELWRTDEVVRSAAEPFPHEEFADRTAGVDRVWLVSDAAPRRDRAPADTRALEEALGATRARCERRTFGDVVVTLYAVDCP